MSPEEEPVPSEKSILAAMNLAWKDHHHARNQTWKTVQMIAVLGAGLLTVDLQYNSFLATALSGLLVILTSAVGIGITWNHRKLEIRKFIHILNCEEKLGLHRDDIIPLLKKDNLKKDVNANLYGYNVNVIKYGMVSLPKMHKIFDVVNPFRHNTSLFIIRIHVAIMAFSFLIIFLRWYNS